MIEIENHESICWYVLIAIIHNTLKQNSNSSIAGLRKRKTFKSCVLVKELPIFC